MTDKEKSAFALLEIAHNLQVDNVNMSGENADALYNLIKKQENQIQLCTVGLELALAEIKNIKRSVKK